jgi:hypothetical protein
VQYQLFVPEHEPETLYYYAQRGEKAVGDDLPAGEELPKKENGDQYRKEFQRKKVPQ